jgi:ParB-like chromosome segregation protein Spo0J
MHPSNDKIYETDEQQDRELADLIKNHGLKDPIEVNPQYVIVSGHRRYRACIINGWNTVPVEIKHFKTPQEEFEYLLCKNAYRTKTKEEKIREGIALAEILAKSVAPGRIRDKVGDQIGVSGKTFEAGKKVVEKIDELAEKDPEKAKKLKEDLNKSVSGAAKTIAEMEKEEDDDFEEEYEDELKKAEERRTMFYLKDLKDLTRQMNAIYDRLAAKRTASTPKGVAHMIGNIKEMSDRLSSWLPTNMGQCSACNGTGKREAPDGNGKTTQILCDVCVGGKTGAFKATTK